MHHFKKYLACIIIVVSAIFSTNTMAYDYSKTPASCMSVVESGKEIALNPGSSFNATSTLQDFLSCNLEVLPHGLGTQILYSLFGESIFPPLSQINSFVGMIYTGSDKISVPEIDAVGLEAEFNANITTFPVLIATIEAITFSSFQLISFLLLIFSVYYLANTMNEGNFLGSQINTFWTFMKISFVLALILPLSDLGLNTVQLIILFIAFCGNLLASLIWTILPLFKYSYLNDFSSVDEDLKSSKDASTMQLAESMVMASLCDISSRQALLLNGLKVEEFNETILSGRAMYSCLTTLEPSSIPLISNLKMKSFEHNKTEYCSDMEGVNHTVDCGTLNYSTSHSAELRKKVTDDIFPKARAIATKTIAANCTDKVNLKEASEVRYYTYCSDIDNLTFGTDYEGKPVISLLSGSYDQSSFETDIMEIKTALDSVLATNLSEEIMNGEEVSEQIEEKISFALNKGWFNAGSFLFDIGGAVDIKNKEYEAVMLSLGYIFPTRSSNSINVGGHYSIENLSAYNNVSGTTSLNSLYEHGIVKGNITPNRSKTALTDIFLVNENLLRLGLGVPISRYKSYVVDYIDNVDLAVEEKTSIINKLLFPTLIMGKEFNRPEDLSKESCALDYNNCKVIPVNPIANIISTSRSATSYTGIVLSVVKGFQGITNIVSDYAVKKERNKISSKLNRSSGLMFARSISLIIGFFAMFLGINLILALIAGYLLPIVIFVYFVGNVLSWLISLVFAICGSTLWMGLHLMPSKEEGFAGHAKKGYVMVMDVFLKPVFIILGVFGAYVLSNILVVVFNVTFEIVMSTFSFFESPKSVIEIFYNFLLNFVYLVFLMLIFFRSAKAVYKIPNALDNWIGLIAYDDASMWKEVTSLIQTTFTTNLKGFILVG